MLYNNMNNVIFKYTRKKEIILRALFCKYISRNWSSCSKHHWRTRGFLQMWSLW